MKIASRLLILSAAVVGFSGLTQAQAPDSARTRGGVSPSGATGASSMPNATHATGNRDGMEGGTDAAATDPTAFVKGATMGGMAEIELAKLALSKSKDATIRSFADRMVKDHRKAGMELAAIAKGKGFDVPTSLNAEDEKLVKAAAGKAGADFDVWYSKQMVIEHEKAVALFQAATSSSDGDLAGFAKKTLPTLKEHQQMASALPGASPP
jgi:putative membrane protein